MSWTAVWVVIAVLCLLLEAVTTALVSIWFSIGAAAALGAGLLGADGTIQVCVFAFVSALTAIAFVIYRKRWKRDTKDMNPYDPGKFNMDRLVGRVVYIDETVDNIKGTGGCKIDGQYWTCRTEDDETELAAGEKACVMAVRGSRLVVKPVGNAGGAGEETSRKS